MKNLFISYFNWLTVPDALIIAAAIIAITQIILAWLKGCISNKSNGKQIPIDYRKKISAAILVFLLGFIGITYSFNQTIIDKVDRLAVTYSFQTFHIQLLLVVEILLIAIINLVFLILRYKDYINNVRTGDTAEEAAMKDEDNRTALLAAAREGDTGNVKVLLDSGIDVNTRNTRGWSALMLAAANGQTETMQVLINRGAWINEKGTMGHTALMLAAGSNHLAVVKLLLDNKVEVNKNPHIGRTALMKAVERGHHDIVKILLDKGAFTNVKDKSGETALTLAAAAGHTDIVQSLLAKGALANLKGKDNQTALMLAAEKGSPDIVRLLLNEWADVHAKDDDGQTALIKASANYKKTVDLLEQAEAEK